MSDDSVFSTTYNEGKSTSNVYDVEWSHVFINDFSKKKETNVLLRNAYII